MQTYNRTLAPAIRDDVLDRACARNAAMDVSILGRRDGTGLKSRFLKKVAGEKGVLVIEAPTKGATPIALYPGDSIEAILLVEGERYGFRATVRSRARARLSGHIEVSAITIDYPQVLSQMQRRRHYRVKVPALDPIPVTCVGKAPAAEGKRDKGELVRFTAPATDISAGGICLKMPKDQAHLTRVGTRLALDFSIRTSPKMRLVGVVRHSRQTPDRKDFLAGLEFIGAEKTIAGKRAVDRIMRYVTRRQREELKKKSGLE